MTNAVKQINTALRAPQLEDAYKQLLVTLSKITPQDSILSRLIRTVVMAKQEVKPRYQTSMFQVKSAMLTVQPAKPLESHLEPHFQQVARAIINGKIVPVLGSGINLCDRQNGRRELEVWEPKGIYPPTHRELYIYLLRNFKFENYFSNYFSEVTLPSGITDKLVNERSFWIKDLLSVYRMLHLSEYADLISFRFGQIELQETLKEIFKQHYIPNQIHDFFAKLPQTLRQKGYET